MDMNCSLFCGRVSGEPRQLTAGNGGGGASVLLKATKKVKDREISTTMEVTAWGDLARELLGAHDGDLVFAVGELSNRKWEDKTSGETKWKTNISANKLSVIRSTGHGVAAVKTATATSALDEIPF